MPVTLFSVIFPRLTLLGLALLLAGCATSGLDSTAANQVRALEPRCDAGDSAACYEAGRLYNAANHNSTNVAPAIPILTRGAKIGTREGLTREAMMCADELATAYEFMAYGLLLDHNDAVEGQEYVRRAKQLYVYLHGLGYPKYANREVLKITLDDEDDAFASACASHGRLLAMDRAGNAAMMQQAAAGLATGLQQVQASQPTQSNARSAAPRSQHSGQIGILSHGGIYGNSGQTNSGGQSRDTIDAIKAQGKGRKGLCPGQTCGMACHTIQGRVTAAADLCAGAYSGNCTCQ